MQENLQFDRNMAISQSREDAINAFSESFAQRILHPNNGQPSYFQSPAILILLTSLNIKI